MANRITDARSSDVGPETPVDRSLYIGPTDPQPYLFQRVVTTPGVGAYRTNAAGVSTAFTHVSASAFLVASDERLKTDISPLDDPLAILNGLRGVRFKWAKEGDSGVGVIAQEVRKALPEAVVGDENNEGPQGTLSVDVVPLVAVLIEAVKSLAARLPG